MSFLSTIFGKRDTVSELQPFELGLVLAASLVEGGDPDALAQPELEFLNAGAVSKVANLQERFMIRTAAAACGINLLLAEHLSRAEVERGFAQGFSDQAAKSQSAAIFTALHLQRLPMYLRAGMRDMQQMASEADTFTVSEVAYTFADRLVERSKLGEAVRGNCIVIAIAIAPTYWQAQVQGARELFQRDQILR